MNGLLRRRSNIISVPRMSKYSTAPNHPEAASETAADDDNDNDNIMPARFGKNNQYETPEDAPQSSPDPTNRAGYRTLDDFLSRAAEEAAGEGGLRSATTNIVASIPTLVPWKFWLIFLSLGVANSSDASEILCLSYVL